MDTRKEDLESLKDSRSHARNQHEREMVDRTVGKIMRETPQMRSTREKLVGAVRNGDRNAVFRFQSDLRKMKFDKTYGKEE